MMFHVASLSPNYKGEIPIVFIPIVVAKHGLPIFQFASVLLDSVFVLYA